MSLLFDNSDAVTGVLNTGTYSPKFSAATSFAQWQGKHEVAESDGLRVDVVPVSKLEAELETKKTIAWQPRTDIVVRKKFKESDLSEADGLPKNEVIAELVGLVESIFASLVAKRVGAGSAAAWIKEEILAAYMPSHLRERRQFTGVIRVTHGLCTGLP